MKTWERQRGSLSSKGNREFVTDTAYLRYRDGDWVETSFYNGEERYSHYPQREALINSRIYYLRSVIGGLWSEDLGTG